MGLRILHSADWHLGSGFASFSDSQRQELTRAQEALPGKLAELVREKKCQLVLLAGDIFDTATPEEKWVKLLKKALAEMAVPVFISPGNHDYCCPGSPWLEESWPENVRIFTGKWEVSVIPELNCRVYGAGYQSMDCPALLENFRAEGQEKWKIGVLHGDCVQQNSPYCPVSAAQIANSGLEYLALGHIHKGGFLEKNGTLCAWPGCPMGRGWDETGEKGVLVVDLAENAKIEAVKLDTPRFYDLELEETELFDRLPPGGNRDFYRITLTGEEKQALWQIREELAGFPNLLLRDQREAPVELWAEVGEDTLRGVYFRMLKEQDAALTARITHRLLQGKEVKL